MLASYFPKPANPLMGNWALAQAQAFLRAGIDVSVVSGTAWVPASLSFLGAGAAAYAACPRYYRWGELDAYYPRWPFYPINYVRPLLNSHPGTVLFPTWLSIRSMLLKMIDRVCPDVIYAHHTQVNGYLAWRIHRMTGIPYVITDHDFGEIEECRNHPARRRFFAPILNSAYRVLGVAKRMELLTKELFPSASSMALHPGSDPPPAAAFDTPRPPELASKLIVFCACAFYERKGLPLLVRAFARVAPAFPDAILRISGDGQTRPDVEKAISNTGMASRVQLLGRLPNHTDVLQEMIWADVFASPGWDEPFATTFMEALSAGCPVIYASDGGIADVVVDGVHGVAVEPRREDSLVTALTRLLRDAGLRRNMAAAALQLFDRELTWDHNAALMKSLFTAAIASREAAIADV